MDSKVECRNCRSAHTLVSTNGRIAPFFARRVLHVESVTSLGETVKRKANESSGRKGMILGGLLAFVKAVPFLRNLLQFRSNLSTRIRVCKSCGFVGPDHAYSFAELVGLYVDYRSETYNKERCLVEPGYEQIQHQVGKTSLEMESRLKNVDSLLERHADLRPIHQVLDWGGGDGAFVPTGLTGKSVTVLDVSNEPLVNAAYNRVERLEDDQQFDYVQICHVLEHVSEPLETVKDILFHVKPGGLLYIEVPQDRANGDIDAFKSGAHRVSHTLHEHINLYNATAVEMLGAALGLKQLAVNANSLEFGWARSTVISGLFQK